MKNKKLNAGFVLCIVGATLRLAIAAFLILVAPFSQMGILEVYFTIDGLMRALQYEPLGLIFLGFALAMILLSVYGKKGGRKEAAGVVALSCLMLSPLALIGSILMLRAIPKQQVAAPKAPDKGEVPAEETQNPAPMSEGEPSAAGAVLSEGKSVAKQGGSFSRFRKIGTAVRGRVQALRTRLSNGTGSKLPAFCVITAFFVLFFVLTFGCYVSDFFRFDMIRAISTFWDPMWLDEIWRGEAGINKICLALQSWWRDPLTGGYVPLRRLVMLMLFALSPAYLVYLGAHNPFKLPKGYAPVLIVLGAIGYVYSDLMVVSNCILSASVTWKNGQSYATLIYLLLVSLLCAQIATLFIFPYFVNDKASSKAAIGIVIGATLLLPLVAAIIVSLLVLLAILALVVFFAYLALYGVMLLIHSSNDPFLQRLRGDPVETKEYTFTTDMGTTMTVYSQDGKRFYTDNGAYVGHSDDGGHTIICD